MNLAWSDEQRMLIDSAQRFASRRYTTEVRTRSREGDEAVRAGVWADLAEQGWLGVAVPRAAGGFGGGALEIGILAEATGRCLLLEPFVPTAVEAVRLLNECTGRGEPGGIVAEIAAGTVRVAVADIDALAHTEASPAGAHAAGTTRAERTAQGWVVDGAKRFVMDGHADRFVVSAVDAATGEPALFLIDTAAPGVERALFRTVDDRLACHLALRGVAPGRDARLTPAGGVPAALAAARDAGSLARCAEAIGAMEVLLEQTLAYTRIRTQFGRPLAANQVLRHRLVDMAVMVREARALALRAAILRDQSDATDAQRRRALVGAVAKASQAARSVGEEAIQMHGAMGVTEELSVGLHVKRLMACQMAWGPLPELYATRWSLEEGFASPSAATAPTDRPTVEAR